jgi:2-oxoglutarate ferredoxin oxidoreductase subunit alpha
VGPSTGLPTKTEQADLLQAMYGRHGESPIPIVAPHTPASCFDMAIEAARIALKYRTPVLLLSDGYLANGSEPWRLPDVGRPARHLGAVRHRDRTTSTPTATPSSGRTCATRSPWPGRGPCPVRRAWSTASVASRRQDGTGNISYDPANHEHMVHLRAQKVAGIANDIPPVTLLGDVDDAELLVVGWGSTWGAIDGAANRVRARGHRVAHAHLTHLNPFPPNLGEVLAAPPSRGGPRAQPRAAVPLLRAEYLVDARSVTKVQGLPFTAGELEIAFLKELGA